jgi:hypothetical protein
MNDKNTDTMTPAPERVFAVFRNDVRVSNSEYPSIKDAQHEYEYWRGIISRWPDASRLAIREMKWRRKETEIAVEAEQS